MWQSALKNGRRPLPDLAWPSPFTGIGPPPALCEQVAPWTTDLPAAYLGLGTLRVDLRDYAVPAGYQLRSVRGGWDTD